MTDQQLLNRISLNPDVMVGKPVIKGTRLTVEYILNLLAHGTTYAEILDEYNDLTEQDIQACLLYATKSLRDTEILPVAFASQVSSWNVGKGFAERAKKGDWQKARKILSVAPDVEPEDSDKL